MNMTTQSTNSNLTPNPALVEKNVLSVGKEAFEKLRKEEEEEEEGEGEEEEAQQQWSRKVRKNGSLPVLERRGEGHRLLKHSNNIRKRHANFSEMMPTHILQYLFQYLYPFDLSHGISRVNRTFFEVGNQVWKRLETVSFAPNYFPTIQRDFNSWYDYKKYQKLEQSIKTLQEHWCNTYDINAVTAPPPPPPPPPTATTTATMPIRTENGQGHVHTNNSDYYWMAMGDPTYTNATSSAAFSVHKNECDEQDYSGHGFTNSVWTGGLSRLHFGNINKYGMHAHLSEEMLKLSKMKKIDRSSLNAVISLISYFFFLKNNNNK
ncbi:hypothetical protein RFI_02646 [Reticulomyxa filosa]|uniref:F-box domain-containing protein n=1 Tax=Reticulomyxa filosa TaxID=46433 RepID=X6P8R4_RETFI|nr:hypothetical protein RFI_02646 [Reticulomyxa filosa]|eukprot:ETO34444.1 hypothetical protein RFI_02646 [Reticulomyxa filosa]